MAKWFDLGDPTVKIKFHVDPNTRTPIVVLLGVVPGSPAWDAAKAPLLGFAVPKGVTKPILTRRMGARDFIRDKDLRTAFPNARSIEVADITQYRMNFGGAGQQVQSRAEQAVMAATTNAALIGMNALGQQVFENPMAERFAIDANGNRCPEGTVPAELCLRGDGSNDALLAQGYLQGLLTAVTADASDIRRFVRLCHGEAAGDDVEQVERMNRLIKVEMMKRLVDGHEIAGAGAYGEAQRLYEYSAANQGVSKGGGAMPLPATVIVQEFARAFGSDDNQNLVYIPKLYDGALASLLGANYVVYSEKAPPESREARMRALVPAHVKRFERAADENIAPHKISILNVENDSPETFGDILEMLDSRDEQGLTVIIAPSPTVTMAKFLPTEGLVGIEGFARTVSDRYEIQGLLQLAPVMRQKMGIDQWLNLLVVGRRFRPTERAARRDNEILQGRLDQVRHRVFDWDVMRQASNDVLAGVHEAAGHAWTNAERAAIEKAAADAAANRLQLPYQPFSKNGQAEMMIPRNLAGATYEALSNLAERVGDVDEYVRNAAGLSIDQYGYLAPEQVDADALAVAQMDAGSGFLLGDRTGVGKGVTLATLTSYAWNRGLPVIFVTKQPSLFSDFYRDLKRLGVADRMRPMILNYTAEMVDQFEVDADGNSPVVARGVNRKNFRENYRFGLESVGNPNLILTTYSQFSAGEDGEKSDAAIQWSKNAIVIFDESHIAAGESSNMGIVCGQIKDNAVGVVYSSATSIKDAAHISFYSRLLPESMDVRVVEKAIAAGGDAIAEALVGSLARDGRMIRRERDSSTVVIESLVDTAHAARNDTIANQCSVILQALQRLTGVAEQVGRRLTREQVGKLDRAGGFIKTAIQQSKDALKAAIETERADRRASRSNSAPVRAVRDATAGRIANENNERFLRGVDPGEQGAEQLTAVFDVDGVRREDAAVDAAIDDDNVDDMFAPNRVTVASGALAFDPASLLIDDEAAYRAWAVANATPAQIAQMEAANFTFTGTPLDLLDLIMRPELADSIGGVVYDVAANDAVGEPAIPAQFLAPMDDGVPQLDEAPLAAESFNTITLADLGFSAKETKSIQDDLADLDNSDAIKRLQKRLKKIEQMTRRVSTKTAAFGNFLFYSQRAVNVALQASFAGDEAVAEIRAGRKPIIFLEHTFEKSLQEAIESEDAVAQEDGTWIVQPPRLKDYLSEIYRTVANVSHTDATGVQHAGLVTDQQFGPTVAETEAVKEGLKVLEDLIDTLPDDLYMSPIDVIGNAIRKAGFRVAEASGRKVEVLEMRDDGTWVAGVRSKDSRNITTIEKAFNFGDADALIGNKAMSTGMSLHSSVDVTDQRQRTTMFVQVFADINDYIQGLGRADRRGQVNTPLVKMLSSGLPSESRVMMSHFTKIRRLLAATTSSRENEFETDEVIDLYNSLGDASVRDYLQANPGVGVRLGIPFGHYMPTQMLDAREVDHYSPGLARYVVPRLDLFEARESRGVFAELSHNFREVQHELDQAGINPLRTNVVDLSREDVAVVSSTEDLMPARLNEHGDVTTVFDESVKLMTILSKTTFVAPTWQDILGRIERSVLAMRIASDRQLEIDRANNAKRPADRRLDDDEIKSDFIVDRDMPALYESDPQAALPGQRVVRLMPTGVRARITKMYEVMGILMRSSNEARKLMGDDTPEVIEDTDDTEDVPTDYHENGVAKPVAVRPDQVIAFRRKWLLTNLAHLVPGSWVRFETQSGYRGDRERTGVITSLTLPPRGRETNFARWRLTIQVPGEYAEHEMTLRDLYRSDFKPLEVWAPGVESLNHTGNLFRETVPETFNSFSREPRDWERKRYVLGGNMFRAAAIAAEAEIGASGIVQMPSQAPMRVITCDKRLTRDNIFERVPVDVDMSTVVTMFAGNWRYMNRPSGMNANFFLNMLTDSADYRGVHSTVKASESLLSFYWIASKRRRGEGTDDFIARFVGNGSQEDDDGDTPDAPGVETNALSGMGVRLRGIKMAEVTEFVALLNVELEALGASPVKLYGEPTATVCKLVVPFRSSAATPTRETDEIITQKLRVVVERCCARRPGARYYPLSRAMRLIAMGASEKQFLEASEARTAREEARRALALASRPVVSETDSESDDHAILEAESARLRDLQVAPEAGGVDVPVVEASAGEIDERQTDGSGHTRMAA